MGTETSFLLFVVLHVEEPYSSQQNSAQLDCFLVSVSTNATAGGGGDGVTVASIGSFMQHKSLLNVVLFAPSLGASIGAIFR